MRVLSIMLLAAISAASCNTNGEGHLSSDDSLAIYNAMASQKGGDTSKPRITFKTANFGPKTVSEIVTLHKDYLDNPIFFAGSDTIRYYDIPKEDILTLAGNDSLSSYRLYPGYDKNSNDYHFILVGVYGSGNNHLVDNEVFDDFKPCPNVCDVTEPQTPLENSKAIPKKR